MILDEILYTALQDIVELVDTLLRAIIFVLIIRLAVDEMTAEEIADALSQIIGSGRFSALSFENGA